MINHRVFTTAFPLALLPPVTNLVSLTNGTATAAAGNANALNGSSYVVSRAQQTQLPFPAQKIIPLNIPHKQLLTQVTQHCHEARTAYAAGDHERALEEYREVVSLLSSPSEDGAAPFYTRMQKGRKLMIEATISAARSAVASERHEEASTFYNTAYDVLRAIKHDAHRPRYTTMKFGPQFLLESLAGVILLSKVDRDEDAKSLPLEEWRRTLRSFIKRDPECQDDFSLTARLLKAYLLKLEFQAVEPTNRQQREKLLREIDAYLAVPPPKEDSAQELLLNIASLLLSIDSTSNRLLLAQHHRKWRERDRQMRSIGKISDAVVSSLLTLSHRHRKEFDLGDVENAVAGQLASTSLLFVNLKLYRAAINEAARMTRHEPLLQTPEAAQFFKSAETHFFTHSHVVLRPDELREDATDHGRIPSIERLKAALAHERMGHVGFFVSSATLGMALGGVTCMASSVCSAQQYGMMGASVAGVFAATMLTRLVQGALSEESRSAGEIGYSGIPWSMTAYNAASLFFKSAMTSFGSLAIIAPAHHFWQSLFTLFGVAAP